jgi:hypothetical protein
MIIVPRSWHGLLARMGSFVLDEQLAEGRSPDDNPVAAARARQLVSPDFRRQLVRAWTDVMARAAAGPHPLSPKVTPSQRRVSEDREEIAEMLDALAAPLPHAARGVAMANVLLTDGTGPLFNVHHPQGLAASVRAATRQLVDARASLFGPDQRASTRSD